MRAPCEWRHREGYGRRRVGATPIGLTQAVRGNRLQSYRRINIVTRARLVVQHEEEGITAWQHMTLKNTAY